MPGGRGIFADWNDHMPARAHRNSALREPVDGRAGLTADGDIARNRHTIDGGMMRQWTAACLAATMLLFSSAALAAFHLYTIQQVYSNADGTIQFVVVGTSFNGENVWSLGGRLSSTDSGGTRSISFTHDLPSASTAGTRVLIATQGFADLGIVTPDFIIPNHFIATGSGSVTYVNSTLSYPGGLPTDGVSALNIAGMQVPNVATNFAGESASVQPAAAALNFQGIWWLPTESGWGINLAHQADTIFASWFTYDTTGKAWWLVASAMKSAPGVYSGDLLRTHGPRFDAYDTTQFKFDKVGTAKFTFADGNTASFEYTVQVAGMAAPVTQMKTITRQLFSALGTTCQ